MEHDSNCELIEFIVNLSKNLIFSERDVNLLRNTTHPILCACSARKKMTPNQARRFGTVSSEIRMKMEDNCRLVVANKNLGIPKAGRFNIRHPPLTQSLRVDGKVIEVDFRNRKRRAD